MPLLRLHGGWGVLILLWLLVFLRFVVLLRFWSYCSASCVNNLVADLVAALKSPLATVPTTLFIVIKLLSLFSLIYIFSGARFIFGLIFFGVRVLFWFRLIARFYLRVGLLLALDFHFGFG